MLIGNFPKWQHNINYELKSAEKQSEKLVFG